MKDIAIKVILEAGEILTKNFGHIKTIEEKSKGQYVTNVDKESQKLIFSMISEKFPDHFLWGEEGSSGNKDSEYKWIVDPVDGTHNYMFGIPLFGISIGLAKNNEIILGVIYLPFYDELYCAEKNKGAFMVKDGKEIKLNVSDKELNKGLILVDSSYYRYDKLVKFLDEVKNKIQHVRYFGCAVFNFTSIANKRADAYLEYSDKPWDNAAGFLICKEAGAIITDYNGDHVNYESPRFIIANKKLHGQILEVVK